MGAIEPGSGLRAVHRRSAALVLCVAVLGAAACGDRSRSTSATTTTAPASTAPPITSTTTDRSSTTVAVEVPTELPRTIVVAHDPPGSPEGQNLALLDRVTGELVEIVSPQWAPQATTGGRWSIAGFDVSPDGGTVAFGLVLSSDAPPAMRGAIYLAPTDRSAAPRLLRDVPDGVTVERFSPDGRWLLAGAGVWTAFPVDGGSPVMSNVLSPYPAFGLQWSSDGSTVVVGEHDERGCCPRVTTMAFDATVGTLTRADTRDGTLPWFTVEGELRVLDDLGEFCVGLVDVDATRRWGLSAPGCASTAPGEAHALTWWSTQDTPAEGEHLPVTPPGNTRGIAW